jgi:aspartyl-tRNA(Asn)/glutamyl-tRNA(Gln) amidotransferase subunit B
MKYEVVIGLEVHVQLSTKTKIFCQCSTEFGADANTHVCPVCLGMPGVLPVLNREVVQRAIKAGLALNCEIQSKNIFARKNYFYPDLPKGYQISQFELPICLNGHLNITMESGKEKRIGITRIHMEEDAGKSIHGENIGDSNASYVDLNRACTPLLEIVSEPDMRSSEEAKLYLQKLKSTIEYLDISDCNMEEGSFRCDANVSIRPFGQKEFGTRTEIKNMNSFKNVQKAIDYEVKRQAKIIDNGGSIIQETRLWDVNRSVTVSMRGKEDAHDYRYFPDPDLVPLNIDEEWIEDVKKSLPELPEEKYQRLINEYKLPEYDASILTIDKSYANFFEKTVKIHNNPKAVSNWIMSEVLRVINEKLCHINETGISPEQLAKIIKMLDENQINSKAAKIIFDEIIETGKNPEDIVKEKGLSQISDTNVIEKAVKEIIEANPKEAERLKNGEKKLQGFFVGQVMKATKGKANPKLVNELLAKFLR